VFLCLTKHGHIQSYGRAEEKLHAFLTSLNGQPHADWDDPNASIFRV